MSPTTPGPRLSRRSLLTASAAGVALLATGCTSSGGTATDPAERRAVDALATQVGVQQAVVDAYAAAATADPALGQRLGDLAGQAGSQLDRLKAAAPSRSSASSPASSSAASSAGASPAAAPPAGQDVQAWLRGQVTGAADSHTQACLDQTGARAALLGSIAAGLRGQADQLD